MNPKGAQSALDQARNALAMALDRCGAMEDSSKRTDQELRVRAATLARSGTVEVERLQGSGGGSDPMAYLEAVSRTGACSIMGKGQDPA